MACFHPFIFVPIGNNKYCKICPAEGNREDFAYYVNKAKRDGFRNFHGDLMLPFLKGCDDCLGCRVDYAHEWANRMVMELMAHDPDHCFFVTLTYESAPQSPEGFPTLRYKDMQDFCKRASIAQKRRYPGEAAFRYCYAGEYAPATKRPHFHGIFYNLLVDDLEFYKNSPSGDPLYVSSWLDRQWGHGYCVIGSVTWASCAYTASYVLKKQRSREAVDVLKAHGVESEHLVMSRRPGIGLQFFDEEVYRSGSDRLQLPGGRLVRPPHIFDKKMADLDWKALKAIKDKRRQLATAADYLRSLQTDLNIDDYFRACEQQAIDLQKFRDLTSVQI